MVQENETETFCPASRKEWRQWLKKNHSAKQSVWLVCYKKHTQVPSITWSEAVDEAICFGWIDSVRHPVDAEKFKQFFGKRKPKSGWSKVNKEKIARLIDEGLMAPAGLAVIETAKQNGSWNILDEVEEGILPKDLLKEFKAHPGSKAHFLSLSKSVRKAMLQWVILAKQPATRQKRIAEIAERAGQKMKPKQF